jgi:cytochrome c-type biogenesis protein CcmH/NrfG
MLADAEHETLEALRLNPEQPDARNLLGAVYAQEGDTASASLVWSELVRDVPDYEPARKNLAIMGNRTRLQLARPAPLISPELSYSAVSNER